MQTQGDEDQDSAPDTAGQNSGGHHDGHVTPAITSSPSVDYDIQAADYSPALFSMAYALEERIGEGASGKVFKARKTKIHKTSFNARHVAVKFLPSNKDRWRREAKVMRALRGHDNIVTLHDLYLDSVHQKAVIVMDCMDRDLGTVLREHFPLPRSIQVIVLREVLQGLAHMHGLGIVHKDIKPDNILLAASPRVAVKIGDFGLSHFAARERVRREGTPLFMAPELCGGTHCGVEVDIWSLGVTMVKLRYNTVPFRNLTRQQVYEHVAKMTLYPPAIIACKGQPEWSEWGDMVTQCLAVDWSQRPTAQQLLQHDLITKHAQANMQTKRLLPYIEKPKSWCIIC